MKQRTEDTEGQKTIKKRKTYQRIDDAIKTMVSHYCSGDEITYLKNIARVLNIMSHKYDELKKIIEQLLTGNNYNYCINIVITINIS